MFSFQFFFLNRFIFQELYGGHLVDELTNMTTTIISVVECRKISGELNVYVHDDQNVCTRHSFNHGCTNGIGNALISRWNRLVGITSWFGQSKGKPDIFTSVLPFRAWIRNLVDNTDEFRRNL